jgi:hypothetical protein
VEDLLVLSAVHKQSVQHRVVGSCWVLGVVCAPVAAEASIADAMDVNMNFVVL